MSQDPPATGHEPYENPLGTDGFGEGNFRALFESLELDQARRGVLSPGTRAPGSSAR